MVPAEEEGDLTPEERRKHGKVAARELLAAIATHNEDGIVDAFMALDALCDESEESAPEE